MTQVDTNIPPSIDLYGDESDQHTRQKMYELNELAPNTQKEVLSLIDQLRTQNNLQINLSYNQMKEQINNRLVHVMFEPMLQCDPLTDHKVPKSLLPIYLQFINDSQTEIINQSDDIVRQQVIQSFGRTYEQEILEKQQLSKRIDQLEIELYRCQTHNQLLEQIKKSYEQRIEEESKKYQKFVVQANEQTYQKKQNIGNMFVGDTIQIVDTVKQASMPDYDFSAVSQMNLKMKNISEQKNSLTNKLQAELQMYLGQIKSMQNQLIQYRGIDEKVKQYEQDIVLMQNKLEGQARSYEGKLKDADDQVVLFQSKAGDYEMQKNQLNQEKIALSTQIEEMRKKIIDYEIDDSKFKTLSIEYQKLNLKLDKKNKEYDDQIKAAQGLQKQLSDADRHIKLKTAETTELTERVNTLTADTKQLQKTNEDLQEQLQKFMDGSRDFSRDSSYGNKSSKQKSRVTKNQEVQVPEGGSASISNNLIFRPPIKNTNNMNAPKQVQLQASKQQLLDISKDLGYVWQLEDVDDVMKKMYQEAELLRTARKTVMCRNPQQEEHLKNIWNQLVVSGAIKTQRDLYESAYKQVMDARRQKVPIVKKDPKIIKAVVSAIAANMVDKQDENQQISRNSVSNVSQELQQLGQDEERKKQQLKPNTPNKENERNSQKQVQDLNSYEQEKDNNSNIVNEPSSKKVNEDQDDSIIQDDNDLLDEFVQSHNNIGTDGQTSEEINNQGSARQSDNFKSVNQNQARNNNQHTNENQNTSSNQQIKSANKVNINPNQIISSNTQTIKTTSKPPTGRGKSNTQRNQINISGQIQNNSYDKVVDQKQNRNQIGSRPAVMIKSQNNSYSQQDDEKRYQVGNKPFSQGNGQFQNLIDLDLEKDKKVMVEIHPEQIIVNHSENQIDEDLGHQIRTVASHLSFTDNKNQNEADIEEEQKLIEQLYKQQNIDQVSGESTKKINTNNRKSNSPEDNMELIKDSNSQSMKKLIEKIENKPFDEKTKRLIEQQLNHEFNIQLEAKAKCNQNVQEGSQSTMDNDVQNYDVITNALKNQLLEQLMLGDDNVDVFTINDEDQQKHIDQLLINQEAEQQNYQQQIEINNQLTDNIDQNKQNSTTDQQNWVISNSGQQQKEIGSQQQSQQQRQTDNQHSGQQQRQVNENALISQMIVLNANQQNNQHNEIQNSSGKGNTNTSYLQKVPQMAQIIKQNSIELARQKQIQQQRQVLKQLEKDLLDTIQTRNFQETLIDGDVNSVDAEIITTFLYNPQTIKHVINLMPTLTKEQQTVIGEIYNPDMQKMIQQNKLNDSAKQNIVSMLFNQRLLNVVTTSPVKIESIVQSPDIQQKLEELMTRPERQNIINHDFDVVIFGQNMQKCIAQNKQQKTQKVLQDKLQDVVQSDTYDNLINGKANKQQIQQVLDLIKDPQLMQQIVASDIDKKLSKKLFKLYSKDSMKQIQDYNIDNNLQQLIADVLLDPKITSIVLGSKQQNNPELNDTIKTKRMQLYMSQQVRQIQDVIFDASSAKAMSVGQLDKKVATAIYKTFYSKEFAEAVAQGKFSTATAIKISNILYNPEFANLLKTPEQIEPSVVKLFAQTIYNDEMMKVMMQAVKATKEDIQKARTCVDVIKQMPPMKVESNQIQPFRVQVIGRKEQLQQTRRRQHFQAQQDGFNTFVAKIPTQQQDAQIDITRTKQIVEQQQQQDVSQQQARMPDKTPSIIKTFEIPDRTYDQLYKKQRPISKPTSNTQKQKTINNIRYQNPAVKKQSVPCCIVKLVSNSNQPLDEQINLDSQLLQKPQDDVTAQNTVNRPPLMRIDTKESQRLKEKQQSIEQRYDKLVNQLSNKKDDPEKK